MTNPKLGHPVTNKNKVPVVQWRKWTNHAKKVFNDMYHAMRPSMQGTITHPEMFPLQKEHWQTLRWNAAWLAADGVTKQGGAARAVRIRQPKTGKAADKITRIVKRKKARRHG